MTGLTRPGAEAWSHGGMWGTGAGDDSPVLTEARRRLEADAFLPEDHGQALAFARLREVAAREHMPEVEAYDRGLSRLAAKADRVRAGQPEEIRIAGKRAHKFVRTRQTTRCVEIVRA